MDTISQDILKSEYDSLRAELKSLVDEMNLMARYAVVMNAAIVTTIITVDKINHSYDHYFKSLPLIVSVVLAFRTYSLYRRLQLISQYIQNNIEAHINTGQKPVAGWETYLNTQIKGNKVFKASFAQSSTVAFWLFLIILSLAFIIIPLPKASEDQPLKKEQPASFAPVQFITRKDKSYTAC